MKGEKMTSLKCFFIFVISVMILLQILLIESVTAQPRFGIGANGGIAKPFSDYPKTGLALSGGVLEYNLLPLA